MPFLFSGGIFPAKSNPALAHCRSILYMSEAARKPQGWVGRDKIGQEVAVMNWARTGRRPVMEEGPSIDLMGVGRDGGAGDAWLEAWKIVQPPAGSTWITPPGKGLWRT